VIARVIVGLLVIWLAFVVIGFVFKSLLWLAVIGIVLFLGTTAYGAIKRRNTGQLNR
jgi:FtsH-binding integral membrane protein